MRGSLVVVIALIAVFVVAGFFLFGSSSTKSPSNSKRVPPTSHIITITSSKFSPSVLSVNKGDTVTFVNQGDSLVWPASNIHPTHTVYPGSGIQKCGTSEAGNIFDACRGLRKGEKYSFKFNEIGKWKYHDHLNPSSGGTIIVK